MTDGTNADSSNNGASTENEPKFIREDRLGSWFPEDDNSEEIEAKDEDEGEEDRPRRLGEMPKDVHSKKQAKPEVDEEQVAKPDPKSKEQDLEFKRLKNAVPALQRQVQEYRNKLNEFNPEAIEKQTLAKVQDEIAKWFTTNPDEVIEHALRAKGVDPTQFYRDKFLSVAEFEQKPEDEKRAIMAEREHKQKLTQAEQRLQQYEKKEAEIRQQQEQQERAKFRSDSLQFVAKYCQENGLPHDNPIKVARVVEQLIEGLEKAQSGDPRYAGFDETKVAKFYKEASWKEQVYDMQHLEWDDIKDLPEAQDFVANCQRIIKKALGSNGGGTMKRPTKNVSPVNSSNNRWGKFINETQLREIEREERRHL